jgi:hypothetical protein
MVMTSDGQFLLLQDGYKPSTKSFGQVWLIDMGSGKVVQNWDDKQVHSGGFLAFVPNGDLLFDGFVKHTGLHFAFTDPPDGFFADR